MSWSSLISRFGVIAAVATLLTFLAGTMGVAAGSEELTIQVPGSVPAFYLSMDDGDPSTQDLVVNERSIENVIVTLAWSYADKVRVDPGGLAPNKCPFGRGNYAIKVFLDAGSSMHLTAEWDRYSTSETDAQHFQQGPVGVTATTSDRMIKIDLCIR